MDIEKNIAYLISTFGAIGYLPASGSVATILTVPIVLLLRLLCSTLMYCTCVGLLIVVAYAVINKALLLSGKTDPSEIIIDECAGTFIAIGLLPLSVISICGAIIFFRFFDISKKGGVGYCEYLPGALGVLVDDLYAGLLANIVIWIFSMIMHSYV